MSDRYILNADHSVSRCDDLRVWAEAYQIANRRVARDTIGKALVSTVFLGLDHAFGVGAPLLFETMVFQNDGSDEEICERCATWDEAVAQHARVVEQLKAGGAL